MEPVTLATAHCFLIFLTLTIISLSASSTFQPMPLTSRKLVIKLVHRDSIHSPYYNKNDNVTNRIKRAIGSSILPFTYLQKKVGTTLPDHDFQADILPAAGGSFFFVNISVGQPPVPQFTVMDTGSSLLWIRCHPCRRSCSEQLGPIFDPEKSSSYSYVLCNSPYCYYAPLRKCNLLDQCEYSQRYVRGNSSVGILSREQLMFKTSDDGSATIPGVIVGCSHEDGSFKDHQISGVIGLGFNNISLVAQLGYKFSYCIGNVFDQNYSHSKLILGNGAMFEGDSTPLEVINGYYYITLEGISAGEKNLIIDSNVFIRKMSKELSGVIIDSSSTLTWLVKEGFEALCNEVQSLLDVWLKRFWYEYDPSALCYMGTINQDLVGFPAVAFHFAGGADLVLDTGSLFVQLYPFAFCMAVLPSDAIGSNITTDLSVIGMLAQQNYNIGYDIYGKTMYFQRIDCELLDD